MTDRRICFVGDSFVNGTGDPEKLGWTGRFAATLEARDPALEITHYNLGIRRNTSSDIRERWLRECEARLVDGDEHWVIFSFGVNDTVIENGALRVPVAQSVINVREILADARERYNVCFIGPPPVEDDVHNQRIRALDLLYAECCRSLDVPYLSVVEQVLQAPVWKEEVASNDGAHPRAEGYRLLAGLVTEWDHWPEQ